MLRGLSRLTRLLALAACLPLPATRAGAVEILIDDFSGTPALGAYADLGANGLGQILPFGTTFELDYLGDLLGMRLAYGSLAGVDLTASSNGALALDILSLVPSSGPVNLVISVNGGASTLGVPIPIAITGTGTLLLPFGDFSDPSAFASVNDLRLVFTAGTSFAFAADDLRSVPEPATAAMLALGLLGLAFAGRRRVLIAVPSRPAANPAR
jgi:hypothetical protein